MIKRAWLISDLHFGCRSNSLQWLEFQTDYFYKWFIPMIEKDKKEGDVLFILGDVFDNRQSLNILIMNKVIKLFEDFAKIIKVYVLVGNHDIYAKNSNDITSLLAIKHIPNVTLIQDPIVLDTGNYKSLMMPWRKNSEHEIETIKKYKTVDFVFCHSEIKGVKLNKKSVQKDGTDLTTYADFKAVFTGHIHYSQKLHNVSLIGNPYEMTRSDIHNIKGVHIVDFRDDYKVKFVENNFSPRFKMLNIASIYNTTITKLRTDIKNTFVDIYIPSNVMLKYDISTLLNKLEGYSYKLDLEVYDVEDNIDINDLDTTHYGKFDLLDFTKKFLEDSEYDKKMKKKVYAEIEGLYKEHIGL